jgi:hypothetical protein
MASWLGNSPFTQAVFAAWMRARSASAARPSQITPGQDWAASSVSLEEAAGGDDQGRSGIQHGGLLSGRLTAWCEFA